jgi:HEAT repeat protein
VNLLGQVGAPRVLPKLRPLLEHQDPELRLAAVQALGAIGDAKAAPALLELLGAQQARTRFEAAEALASVAKTAQMRTLIQRLGSREAHDRHAILIALGGSLQRLAPGDSLPSDLRRRIRELLLEIVGGPDRKLAARAIDALSRWGDPKAATVLAGQFSRYPPALRRQLALALGAFDAPAARERLVELARQGRTPVRAMAAAALGEHTKGSEVRELLLTLAERAPWPVPPAASFALARLARRGELEAQRARTPLCGLAASHDPYVRANAAIALAALGGLRCPDGPDPAEWLGPRHATVVRVAGVRWLGALASRSSGTATAVRTQLERCIERDLAREVVKACQQPELPPLGAEADLYAYAADGQQLLVDRLLALRLADGSVLVARTDLNGHLRLTHAPRGPLILDDPVSTPLEP